MKRKIVFPVLATLLVFAFASVTVSCERRPTLRIYVWTHYLPESITRQFEQEFDVRVTMDYYASNEEMFARLIAGGIDRGRTGFDIAFPSGDFLTIMERQGWLEPVDRNLITNFANIDPVILAKSADPYMEFSVPYFYGAAGILVNTAMVPDFEKCWSIFAREDLRGRMVMLDDKREVIGGALSYLGFSVNSRDPNEIAAARDHIINYWRPNLIRFDSETFGRDFASGEVWVVHGFPEVVFAETYGNAQLMQDTVLFIPQGAPAYIGSMVILRGSRNVELAHKFMNFIHRPAIYAEFADTFSFPASANVPARALTTTTPIFTVEQLYYTELVHEAGPAFGLFEDAWFNAIRVE